MSEKLNLPDVGTLANQITARATINSNFTAVENAFDNTLSRDGTTPNQMEADIDMNGNDLLNVQRLDAQELYKGGVPFEQVVAYSDKLYQLFSGNGSQTTFTLSQDPGYIAVLDVSVGGVVQRPGLDFTLVNGAIVFTVAPASATNNILVRYDVALSTGVTGASSVRYTDNIDSDIVRSVQDHLSMSAINGLQAIDPSKWASIRAGTHTADVSSALNTLITDAHAAGYGVVYLPEGHYYLSAPLNLPIDMCLVGAGLRTVLRGIGSPTALVNLNAQNAKVRNLVVSGQGSTPGCGIRIKNGSLFCEVSNVWAALLQAGVLNDDGQAASIVDSQFISCNFGVYSANDFRNSIIDRCHIEGGTGVWLTKSTIQPEGVRITNNTILPSITSDPNSGHGIVLNCGLEMYIGHNIVDNAEKNALLLVGQGGMALYGIKSHGNWYASSAMDAVFVYGNVTEVTFLNDTLASTTYGMHIGTSTTGAIQRSTINNCNWLANGTGDLRIELATDLKVLNNIFTHATNAYREESNTITSKVMYNSMPTAPLLKSSAGVYKENNGPFGLNTNYGSYTPTLTNAANVSSSVAYVTNWSRVGDMVTVAGRVDIAATAAATLTTLRMSVPVSSNFTALEDAGGTAVDAAGTASLRYGILADAATDTVIFQGYPSATGSQVFGFSFMYRVK